MKQMIKAELYFGGCGPMQSPIRYGDFLPWAKKAFAGFSGFTILPGNGFWGNQQEPMWLVVVYGPAGAMFRREIAKIARNYAERFEQEAVLIGFQEVVSELVSAPKQIEAFPINPGVSHA